MKTYDEALLRASLKDSGWKVLDSSNKGYWLISKPYLRDQIVTKGKRDYSFYINTRVFLDVPCPVRGLCHKLDVQVSDYLTKLGALQKRTKVHTVSGWSMKDKKRGKK